MLRPADVTMGMAAVAALEQEVPSTPTTAGLAINLVAAVWPPSALHSESSETRFTGWPWISPNSASAIAMALAASCPRLALGPDSTTIDPIVTGSSAATATQPSSSVHVRVSCDPAPSGSAAQPAARRAQRARRTSQRPVRSEVMKFPGGSRWMKGLWTKPSRLGAPAFAMVATLGLDYLLSLIGHDQKRGLRRRDGLPGAVRPDYLQTGNPGPAQAEVHCGVVAGAQ